MKAMDDLLQKMRLIIIFSPFDDLPRGATV